MANAIGPDVSFYQDDPQTPQGINFIKMRENAYYVIVRAGQNVWGDRDFKVNWREAKAAGLPRGSYWFYDSRVDPKVQAEKWVSMFDGDFGELPLWGDFEDVYNGPFKGWKNWYNFLERVKELIPAGKEIGVYTGYYYWRENTAGVGIPNASLNYFKQYPLWIANYGTASPLVPQPWATWTLWQFTDNGDGTAYGVESLNIDLNYFNGDVNALRQRFGLSNTPLPPPSLPSKNYRVTTSSLKVREGPGLSFSQIGSITLNEVVEKLDENSDGTWLKIRKSDGSLTGWSFAAYLQNLSTTPPPPDDGGGETPEDPTPPSDDEDTNWYRVTASVLKIRSGPGLDFEAIGTFTLGELVEKLEASPDNQWVKVRSKDGTRLGWSFGEYLIDVHNPGEEPPPSVVVPEHSDKNWYRVNTSTLNVRDTPSLSGKILSALSKNDVVPCLDETNPQWAQIQKLDGSIGWCSRDYLVKVSTEGRPTSITQRIAPGVTYLRKDLTSPRNIVVHVLAIDLQTQSLEFLVTPSANNTDVLCTRTTSQFLEEFKLHAAINGGYYSYLDSSNDPAVLCPNGGIPVRISDYAASRGKIYSPKKTAQPVVHIGKKNQVTFNKEPGQVFNAVSGDRLVVSDGKVVKNLAAQDPNPRTAIGLNRNGRWLTLMVVDGRQTGYSEGVTFPELAELLISYGVHTGANMDGGGSSSMTIRGVDGKARVLNSPIEMNQPGKERPVGNHLGLLIKP
ncbi:MAG: hypothetical protein RIR73_1526 [Chloroflexota bacterium]|jgi:GH25 family lysozyme M1 (1,4-beta-N-acetylmuramidase)/uncharacterized protein YraI